MDKREATARFVREQLGLLTSTKTDSSRVKKLRQEFFEKHELPPAARFSNAEVATQVAKLTFKARQAQPIKQTVMEILRVPFIKDEMTQEELEEIESGQRPQESRILFPEDLRKIREGEYLTKVEQEFESKAREQASREIEHELESLREMREEIQLQKEELDKSRSVLDTLSPSIEVVLEEDLKVQQESPEIRAWWKDLGLEKDPFSYDRGLVGIPEEKYDQVVVQTHFNKTFLDLVTREPERLLGNTRVIAGDFGSGKTTLFTLMEYRLGSVGILPVTVTLTPSPNVGGLTVEFLRQVSDELARSLRSTHGTDPRREIGHVDSLAKLGELLELMKVRGASLRLIIFIDGLHKGNKHLTETFDFVQQLQNIVEFIERQGFEVGVLIAGSLIWEKEFHSIRSLSGSISAIDTIPPLTEDDAVESVLRRILAFVRPGGASPNIKKESLRIAFRVLSQRLPSVTFRAYLNHVRDRLNAKAYDELGISVALHVETTEWVQLFIKSSRFADNYKAISRELAPHPQLRRLIGEVLPQVYQMRGVAERDRQFVTARSAFIILRKHGFIQQGKSSRGDVAWIITPELGSVLQGIYNKNKILPADALAALFEEPAETSSKEMKTIYSPLVERYEEASRIWRDSWPELGGRATTITQLLRASEANLGRGDRDSVDSQQMQNSVREAVRLALLSSGIAVESGADLVYLLEKSWFSPENIDDISRFAGGRFNRPTNTTELFGLVHQHAEMMGQLLQMSLEIARGESLARTAGRRLTTADLRAVHSARVQFLNQAHRNSLDMVYTHLEDRIRDVLYLALRAAWGDMVLNAIPPDIRENLPTVPRGHPRAKRAIEENFLYEVSRSEYPKLLSTKNLHLACMGNVLRDIDKAEFKDRVALIFSLGDREAHKDRAKYFREHATDIGDCLRYFPKACEILNDAVLRLFTLIPYSYEKNLGSVELNFTYPSGLLPKSEPIRILATDVERCVRNILETLELGSASLVPVDRLLSVPGLSIEQQLAVVRVMLDQQLLAVDTYLLEVQMTEKGMERLRKIRDKNSGT